MGKLKKGKSRLIVNNESSVRDENHSGNMKFSFQYLDTTQDYGADFTDWEQAGLLSKALETMRGYCCSPLRSQLNTSKFTRYGAFPPPDKTRFTRPAHVPEDAEWARIHITGAAILAGHILEDTFYVVFLDTEHNFFLTRRVTGK